MQKILETISSLLAVYLPEAFCPGWLRYREPCVPDCMQIVPRPRSSSSGFDPVPSCQPASMGIHCEAKLWSVKIKWKSWLKMKLFNVYSHHMTLTGKGL